MNLAELYEHFFDDQHNEATVETYKRVIAINPDLAEAHIGLGRAYCRVLRYDDAIRELELSIGLKPSSPDAHRELGRAYGLLAFDQTVQAISNRGLQSHDSFRAKSDQFYAKAIQSYRKASQIEPNDPGVWYSLGELYLKMKEYRNAIEVLKQGAVLTDSRLCFDELFDAYEKADLLLEGIETMRLWIREKPDNYMAHFTLGKIHVALKDTRSALEEYKALKSLRQEYFAALLFKEIYR